MRGKHTLFNEYLSAHAVYYEIIPSTFPLSRLVTALVGRLQHTQENALIISDTLFGNAF
jgi:hypothetical protein